ncbi:hypothetical protein D3C87_176300 [compost metagenome]
MNPLSCRRGQGVLESLLVLPALVLLFSTLGLLGFRALLFYYTDFHLYEALLCTQHTPLPRCEQHLVGKVKKILLAGKIESHSLRLSSFQVRGQLRIVFGEMNTLQLPPLILDKKIKLPLE